MRPTTNQPVVAKDLCMPQVIIVMRQPLKATI